MNTNWLGKNGEDFDDDNNVTDIFDKGGYNIIYGYHRICFDIG